ncbi:MAG: hypothetical protein LLG08_11190 [Actinomycetia bacterium]|nr:hypothetical protein [Actinomycetes bacterium]
MSVIALGEKLLGEPGAFMAAYGIVGECAAEKRASYRFLGTVNKPGDAA